MFDPELSADLEQIQAGLDACDRLGLSDDHWIREDLRQWKAERERFIPVPVTLPVCEEANA